jgi:hypothetical protein
MPTKKIQPRWGSHSGDTSAPHYLPADDIATLAQRYSIASPEKLAKELRRVVRAIWMYQLSPKPSLAEQRAALLELAHYADPLSDRLRRGVLDPESRRRLIAAYAGLDPDWRKQNVTGRLLSDEMISAMRRQARDQLDHDITGAARLAQNSAVAAGKIKVVPGTPGDPSQRYAKRRLGEAFAAATGKRRGGRTQFIADVLDLLAKRGIRKVKELPSADG